MVSDCWRLLPQCSMRKSSDNGSLLSAITSPWCGTHCKARAHPHLLSSSLHPTGNHRTVPQPPHSTSSAVMSPNGQTIVARHAGEPAAPAEPAEPKARKACSGFPKLEIWSECANWLVTVNCRRQKMKCRIDSGNICRRCRRSGNPCIFVPRSNASVPFIPGSLPLTDPTHIEFNSEILRRLQSIEEYIGLSRSKPNEAEAGDEIDMNGEDELQEEDSSLNSLWEAVRCLERISPSSIDALIWRRSIIKHLWQMYVTLSRAQFLSANTTPASMKRHQDSTFFQANNGFLPLGHCFWLLFYTAQVLVELLK